MVADTADVVDVAPGERPTRVLVVDDQAAVSSTVARWLDREGMECRVASSGPEARRMAENGDFDIVFTDVHMPGGSGLELARALKAADPAIQVIVMTGNTTLETAIEAIRLDADDYLVKPFEGAALVHSARRAAEHRRLLLESRHHRRLLERRVREQARRIERLYLASVHSLVAALEAKDRHTRGHSERVAEYAVALNEALGWVADPESLRIGAQLHDIGKIGMDSGVLRKRGKLTDGERSQILMHPSIGVQILSPMLEDRVILEIVRYHHERWDGTGYPDRLRGDEIPAAARIVAVADTFDAMTTSRPYRAALAGEAALEEIESQAGRQFDPRISDIAGDALLGTVARAS